MRAVVLDAPGPPSALQIRELPVPTPRAGEVLLRVHAFGLNRSELHTRLGLAGDAVTFPRVPGIEATGRVVSAPGNAQLVGRKAVAMMGGSARQVVRTGVAGDGPQAAAQPSRPSTATRFMLNDCARANTFASCWTDCWERSMKAWMKSVSPMALDAASVFSAACSP